MRRARSLPWLSWTAAVVGVAVVVVVSVASFALAAGLVGWGSDINSGDGPKLVERFRGELCAIVGAAPAARPEMIRKFADAHGVDAIEVVKRSRNPELFDLHVALLDSADWHVQHRALYALEYFHNPVVVPRAAKLMAHENARLRERAALTVLKLWPAKGEPTGAAEVKKTLAERLRVEPDGHVRGCLEALEARLAGKLKVERVYEEFTVDCADGLRITPFLDGMDKAASVAPGYAPKGVSHMGGADASKFGAAGLWTTPLLGYDAEEVDGTGLQPFANLRQNGTVHHTGKDVGACLDGAGYYACADGVVRFVHSGSDMGTLLVVQHSPDGRSLVNAVYMHGGDTVFVEAGERVRARQLLGTMGMSYSLENGGHFAHLHFGMYPGAFSATHNYGYKPVKAGLADWHDPAKFLPRWIARTAPAVGELRPLDPALAKALDAARREDLAKAMKETDAVAARKDVSDALRADIDTLRAAIAAAPAAILRRAESMRDAGCPRDALAALQAAAPRIKGLAGEQTVTGALAAWPKDVKFARSLEAEKQFESTEAAAAKLAGKKDCEEKVGAMWRKLLEACADTYLRERVEEKLGGAK